MTLSLVRHARAGSRSRWDGPDADRPLDPRGRDQAAALAAHLAEQRPARVLSSRYLRCTQTVGPTALRLGLVVEVHDALAEGASPKATLSLLDELAQAGDAAVLCSHGDVIPDAIERLGRRGVLLEGARDCAKGSVWELDVEHGRIVRARYVPPLV